MGLFLSSVLVTALLAAGLGMLVAQWRSQLSPAAVGFLVAFGFIAIIVALIVGFILSMGPPGPDEIDAGGMAIAAISILGAMQAVICLVVGLPAAWAGAAIVQRRRP